MTLKTRLLCGAALAALALGPAAAQETAPAAEAPAVETAPETAADTAPAPATDLTADTVIATVNGIDITLGHMIVMRARLPEQYQSLPDETLYTGILAQMIEQIALTGDMEGKLSRGSELALENERRAFLAGEALSAVAKGAVTDEALNAIYAERYAEAAPSQEFNASHILVETEEEATAIKAELDAGADFNELAQTRSTGPSGPNGGDLGWFSEGMMVEPFEQAALLLQPGEISGPVQTDFGWHIIRMNELRMKEAPALDEVRGELTETLQRQAIDAAIAAATEGAEVVKNEAVVDPAILKNIELVAE